VLPHDPRNLSKSLAIVAAVTAARTHGDGQPASVALVGLYVTHHVVAVCRALVSFLRLCHERVPRR
jgi:hypothetical protein